MIEYSRETFPLITGNCCMVISRAACRQGFAAASTANSPRQICRGTCRPPQNTAANLPSFYTLILIMIFLSFYSIECTYVSIQDPENLVSDNRKSFECLDRPQLSTNATNTTRLQTAHCTFGQEDVTLEGKREGRSKG